MSEDVTLEQVKELVSGAMRLAFIAGASAFGPNNDAAKVAAYIQADQYAKGKIAEMEARSEARIPSLPQLPGEMN